MKVEIKTNKLGVAEKFIINGTEFSKHTTGLEINYKLNAGELPELIIKAWPEEFILDSENTIVHEEVIKNEN